MDTSEIVPRYVSFWTHYFDFSGRTSATTFWIIFIINLIVFGVIFKVLAIGGSLLALAMFIPNLSLSVRRLHDKNYSGWLLLIFLIPVIGYVIILILSLLPGDEEPNSYGQPENNNNDTNTIF